jgi:hypothetical protein
MDRALAAVVAAIVATGCHASTVEHQFTSTRPAV